MRKEASKRMQILVVWRDLPLYYDSSTSRIFYFLKYAANQDYDVSLVTFNGIKNSERQVEQLKEYCKDLIVVPKPDSRMWRTLIEASLSPRLLRDRVFPTHFYSREMHKRIDELISRKSFDILYCDRPMLPFVIKANSIKILDLVEPVLYSQRELVLSERNLFKKLLWLSVYYQYRLLDVPKYRCFDACVTVSSFHKDLLESYKAANVNVIPYGIDLEYFQGNGKPDDKPVLIFTGAMSYIHNVKAVHWFYDEVFPRIRSRVPGTELLIVGNKPAADIRQLAEDKAVTVTGFVDDVRPYFDSAAVVIVPIITDDGGFKIKILEAMAMGKPIVSTSYGAKGIDVCHGENIIIADKADEFADGVVSLLRDAQLRQKIRMRARKMVEDEYSWELMSRKLSQAFKDIAGQRDPAPLPIKTGAGSAEELQND